MNPEVKERWLAALRSGEFKQTDGYLATADNEGKPNGFCCLGVLCEIAVADGVIKRFRKEEEDFFHYGDKTGDLPLAVIEWAELVSYNPEVTVQHVHSETCGGNEHDGWCCDFAEHQEDSTYALAALNDDHKWNFEQIADAIERGL